MSFVDLDIENLNPIKFDEAKVRDIKIMKGYAKDALTALEDY